MLWTYLFHFDDLLEVLSRADIIEAFDAGKTKVS